MKRIFLQGDKGALGRVKRALESLKNHKRNSKNKVVDKVLFDMINGNKKHLKKYFESLRNFNKQKRAEEEKKIARRNALLRKLLFGSDMKKGLSFYKLREHKNREIIKELKNQLQKAKFLGRLIMA